MLRVLTRKKKGWQVTALTGIWVQRILIFQLRLWIRRATTAENRASMHNKLKVKNTSHFERSCPKFTLRSRSRHKARQPINCRYANHIMTMSLCVFIYTRLCGCVCARKKSRVLHPVARLNHCLTTATVSLIYVWELPSTIYSWPSIFPPWCLKRIIMSVKNLRENNISALCKFTDRRQMFPWPRNTNLSIHIKTYRYAYQYFHKLMIYTYI